MKKENASSPGTGHCDEDSFVAFRCSALSGKVATPFRVERHEAALPYFIFERNDTPIVVFYLLAFKKLEYRELVVWSHLVSDVNQAASRRE
jgi:hypothetical protein